MAFAAAGLYFMRKKQPDLFTGTLIFMLIFTYVILSWWSWWYGGSFGLRAFIDIYGLMAFPLASFITYIGYGSIIRSAVVIMLLALTGLQMFQSNQYNDGLIHYDSMTKEAYWASFLRRQKPAGWEYLLKTPDYDNARKYGVEKISN